MKKKSYHCYKKLLNNYNHKNARIIYGKLFEFISDSYNLIIIDCLATGMLNNILNIKTPLIFYNGEYDLMHIRKDIFLELSKRFYIAKNKDELDNFLFMFKKGKLNSKWNDEIANNHIYPSSEGNPGKNISKYIQTIIR